MTPYFPGLDINLRSWLSVPRLRSVREKKS